MTEFSMNEVTTFRWSLEQDVENYRHAGYSSIGVWRNKLHDLDGDHAVDLLTSSGLSVSNLSWAGGFTGVGGATLRESIDDAADAVRLAASIQARCLVVHPGCRNNHISRHAFRLLRMALDELLPLAHDCEVPLVLEPMHASCAPGWTFLTDVDSVLELIDDYDTPYLRLAYDTYHFPRMSPDRELLSELAPYLGIVYLSDRRRPPSIDQDRCPLGAGELPLGEIVTNLLEAGYSGAFDVRLMGPEIESCHYWELLEQSQLAFAEILQRSTSRSLA